MSELFSIYGVSVVALTMALTQIVKQVLPKKLERFVPIIPLLIGILVVILSTLEIGYNYILGGLVVGLLSMGIFDIDHKTIKIGNKIYNTIKK